MIPRNDQYKAIRDIYLKHRATQIKATGSYENTIFLAFDEMQKETRLSYVSLSMELQKMSKLEINAQPFLYVKHVVEGVYRFWNPLAERNLNTEFNLKYLPSTISRILILVINILFIIGLPMLLFSSVSKTKIQISKILIFVFICFFVGGSSVAQALVEFGTNRYFLPYQPIVSCFALIFYFQIRLGYTASLKINNAVA